MCGAAKAAAACRPSTESDELISTTYSVSKEVFSFFI